MLLLELAFRAASSAFFCSCSALPLGDHLLQVISVGLPLRGVPPAQMGVLQLKVSLSHLALHYPRCAGHPPGLVGTDYPITISVVKRLLITLIRMHIAKCPPLSIAGRWRVVRCRARRGPLAVDGGRPEAGGSR